MKNVAKKIRAFHDLGYDLPDWEKYDYNPIWQTERLFREASKMKGDLFKVFEKEWIMNRKLQKYADMDGVKHTMCHNDINIDNVLLTEDTLDIIDYEFAGYNDPGYDFGRVIAGLEYDVDEPKIKDILEAYFGRPATRQEHLHWMAYSAIHNWYYVGWALYKESINESSRDWMVFFFKQTKNLRFGVCRSMKKCMGKWQIHKLRQQIGRSKDNRYVIAYNSVLPSALSWSGTDRQGEEPLNVFLLPRKV